MLKITDPFEASRMPYSCGQSRDREPLCIFRRPVRGVLINSCIPSLRA